MRAVIAVLPVGAIEQHGPHLPVGVDTAINEGYLARAAAALPDDLPVLILPMQAVGVSVEHAEFPGTLTLLARDGDPRADRDRRQRRPGGLPQAPRHQFPWRQRCRDRRDASDAARTLADAGRQRLVAASRLSGRPVLGPRGGAWNPWRRRRNLAHAGAEAGDGPHGQGARLRERRRGDGARLRAAARQAAARLRLDGERPQRRGRRGRSGQGERGQGRSAPSRMASSASSPSCATCTPSTSRAFTPGRWERTHESAKGESAKGESAEGQGAASLETRAAFRLRARGDGARPSLHRGRRRSRTRAAGGAGRRRRRHPRSGRPARGARRFQGPDRSAARRPAPDHLRQGDQRLDRLRKPRGDRHLQHPRRLAESDGAGRSGPDMCARTSR